MASTSLTTAGARPLPGLLEGEQAAALADELAAGMTVDDSSRLCLRRLPTAVERVMLEKRQAELEVSLAPIGPGDTGAPGGAAWRQARQALAALFAGYPSLRNANVAEMLDTYLAWLADRPAFAIADACRQIGKGEARWVDPATGKAERPSPDFPPPAPRINELISSIARARTADLVKIDKVLAIDRVLPAPLSAEERDRVGLRMAGLAAHMKAPLEAARSEGEERRMNMINAANQRVVAAAWRSEGYEPMPDAKGHLASPGMLKSIGQWPPEGAKRVGARK